MDTIKVYLTNKHKIASHSPIMIWSGTWERELYCWEFKKDSHSGEYLYHTQENHYKLFYDDEYGYWIGRLSDDLDSWYTVEKLLGAVYCETLKGKFYWNGCS